MRCGRAAGPGGARGALTRRRADVYLRVDDEGALQSPRFARGAEERKLDDSGVAEPSEVLTATAEERELMEALYQDTDPAVLAEHWDFVMVFKVHRSDSINKYQKKYSLKKVVMRLANAGLETRMFLSAQQDEVYVKIRAPCVLPRSAAPVAALTRPPARSEERLMAQADFLDYKLLLNPGRLKEAASETTPFRSAIKIVDWKGVSNYSPWDFIYAKVPPLNHTAPARLRVR